MFTPIFSRHYVIDRAAPLSALANPIIPNAIKRMYKSVLSRLHFGDVANASDRQTYANRGYFRSHLKTGIK